MTKEPTEYELNMEAARLEYAARIEAREAKPDELTIESATAYTIGHLEKCGYEGIVILKANDTTQYGEGVIEIDFKLTPAERQEFSMVVWIDEFGKLYGEW